MTTSPASTPADLGALMRFWRDRRGKSQLDLALDTGVSQRHLSFVESGRSVPSRQVLSNLAEGLDIPLRERNALFLAAGYAPLYAEPEWDAPQLRMIRRAVERMVRQHEPWPALVMDRHWRVVMTNAAAPAFFGRFIDLDRHPRPRNLLRLLFDPDGLRPFVEDWPDLARTLIGRLHREAPRGILDDAGQALMSDLMTYPGVDPAWRHLRPPPDRAPLPYVPFTLRLDGQRLSYFSLITTVGTPQNVTAQELRVESLFPADEATERSHEALIGG